MVQLRLSVSKKGQLTGIQVKFEFYKITFATHITISVSENFRTFHLIPLPYQNSICIPEKPCLILVTSIHPFEDAPCQK